MMCLMDGRQALHATLTFDSRSAGRCSFPRLRSIHALWLRSSARHGRCPSTAIPFHTHLLASVCFGQSSPRALLGSSKRLAQMGSIAGISNHPRHTFPGSGGILLRTVDARPVPSLLPLSCLRIIGRHGVTWGCQPAMARHQKACVTPLIEDRSSDIVSPKIIRTRFDWPPDL